MIGNDDLIFLEEHVADGDGFIEEPTGIAAHIEDEALEGIGAKLPEGVGELAVGGVVELREANVADAGLQEESDVHGMAGDFVASEGDDDLYDGALGALEHVGDFAGGEAVGGLGVHLDDDIAGAQAGVIGGRADVGRNDDGVVIAGSDDHAHAIIFAVLVFLEESELVGIEENGVGVEHTKHARNGTLVDGLVRVHGLGVVVLNDGKNRGEVADGGLVVVHVGGGGTNGGAVNAAKDSGDDEDYNDYDQAATFKIHE